MDSSFFYDSLYRLAWYLISFVVFIYVLRSSWFSKFLGEKQSYRLRKVKRPLYIVLIVLAGYLVTKDDELDPEIVELLAEYATNTTTSNNGSVYHLGMWSSLDSSPYEVGLWRIQQYNNAFANQVALSSIEFEDYPKEDWIGELFPDNEAPKWLCDYNEKACLELIYQQSEQAIYLGDVFHKHIKRYDGVFNYTNFDLYQNPSFAGPMMMFGPNRNVLKIKLILKLHDFKLGKRKLVIEQLTNLINHHKLVLNQTPYTISRVLSVLELQDIYKAAAFLIAKTNDENLSEWKPYIDSLAPLNKDQLTFVKSFQYEFVTIYNSILFTELEGLKANLPDIFQYVPLSLLYKPNRTANIMFKALTTKSVEYELIDDRILVHEKQRDDTAIKFDISNAMGSLLAVTATPRYINLDSTSVDLEVLQRLTKYLYFKRLNNDEAIFLSPYTGNEGSKKEGFFCVDSETQEDEPLCLSTI